MRGGERVYLPEWTLTDTKPIVVELDQDVQPPWAKEYALTL
jgi:hypothetical protein